MQTTREKPTVSQAHSHSSPGALQHGQEGSFTLKNMVRMSPKHPTASTAFREPDTQRLLLGRENMGSVSSVSTPVGSWKAGQRGIIRLAGE